MCIGLYTYTFIYSYVIYLGITECVCVYACVCVCVYGCVHSCMTEFKKSLNKVQSSKGQSSQSFAKESYKQRLS